MADSDDDFLFGPSSGATPVTTAKNPMSHLPQQQPTSSSSLSPSSSKNIPASHQKSINNNKNDADVIFSFDDNPLHQNSPQQHHQAATTLASPNNNAVEMMTSSSSSKEKNHSNNNASSAGGWIPRTQAGKSWSYNVVFTPPSQFELEQLQKDLAQNDNNYYQNDATNDTNQAALLPPPITAQTFFTSTQTKCALCGLGNEKDPVHDPLFKPCPCDRVFHRATCFRTWRRGWISPRNFWSCPDCLYNYQMERLRDDQNYLSKEEVKRSVTYEIIKLWAAILVGVALMTTVLALISWGADTQDKNIPVAMKAMLSSVIYGFPEGNETDIWREEFKDPEVPTSQFYGFWGGFLTALIILTIASCVSISSSSSLDDDNDQSHQSSAEKEEEEEEYSTSVTPYSSNSSRYEKQQSRRRNRRNARSHHTRSRRSQNCCGSCACHFWQCYACSNIIESCSRPGGGCSACGNCCSEMRCECPDSLPCKPGDLKGTSGKIMIVVGIVVIAVVLISAVFVIIIYGTKKAVEIHGSMAAMMEEQKYELEGQTVVLGMGESLRPSDSV